MNQSLSPKIRPEHVSRKAVVYLRQSSPQQVRENLESQRLQYALADRARALGFIEVDVIDGDLGSSASIGARPRESFESLVSEVALGQVGAVASLAVSRLSRTDKDWCRLLEVCQVFDTLILDEERVYDLSDIDDQLVLGIKGTLSVVELKVLRMRMLHGRDEKARRGELRFRLPSGFIFDSDGDIVLHPNLRVREAISLIFKKFRELWSARQVYMWFLENDLMVPMNQWGGPIGELKWKPPSHSFIVEALKNPIYAGAYVYGRRPLKTTFEDGRLVKRHGTLQDPEDCMVFLKDHHEGYIDWEEYERNRERLRRNNMRSESDSSVATVRSGQGLLAGILRCGHCGRKLHVRYWGKSGTTPRYFCKGDYASGGNFCVTFGGTKVDQRFSEEILAAISPLGIEASVRAVENLRLRHEDQVRAVELELEQLDYAAQRAFEQYDQVDPRNRLVAQELESRWNVKLVERERVRDTLSALKAKQHPLTEEAEQKLSKLGEDFGQVWTSPACPAELKKKIVHTVIEEVTVKLDKDSSMLRFVIHWKGGCHTKLDLQRPRSGSEQRTSSDALDIIRQMAPTYGDGQIAAVLNKSGLRTGKGKRWNLTRVATARQTYSIAGHNRDQSNPSILSLGQAAKYCDVSQSTIRKLVEWGLLEAGQIVPHAPWEIRIIDLDSQPVRMTIERLKRTGKLIPEGGHGGCQVGLPFEDRVDDHRSSYD
jgi:DNA invertase Pin-like site-specific DNA recombinase